MLHGLFPRNPQNKTDEIRVSAHPKGHGILRPGSGKKPSGVQGCNKSRFPPISNDCKEGASERVPVTLITVLPLEVSHLLSDWKLYVSCTVGDDHQINSVGQMSRTKIEGGNECCATQIEASNERNNKNGTYCSIRGGGGGENPPLPYHHSSPHLPHFDFYVYKAK